MGGRHLRRDGKPVADRTERLQSLLKRSDASMAGLTALADESARFNIGPADRNFNERTLALRVLAPGNASRFQFREAGAARVGRVATYRIEFTEIGRPTVIQSQDHDAPIGGVLLVEPKSGRVARSELRVADPTTGALARIVVDYAVPKALDTWMPVRMSEEYDAGATSVRGTAEYSNFRRFETSGRPPLK
jgi:hypothetical protein